MKIILKIATNTIKENLREPIFLLNILVSLGIIFIIPIFGTLFAFNGATKMIIDSGIGTLFFAGWIATIFCASQAISKEIATGTTLIVLTKPITRFSFYLGKIIGIATLSFMYILLISCSILISIQIGNNEPTHPNYTMAGAYILAILLGCLYGGLQNYLNKKSFSMSATIGLLYTIPLALAYGLFFHKTIDYGGYIGLLPLFFLATQSILIMGFFATAISTKVKLGGTLFSCLLLFIAGVLADYLNYKIATPIFNTISGLIPNWQIYWQTDAIFEGKEISYLFLKNASINTFCFCFAFFILGIMLFQYKEVGTTISRN